jgi:hypothetical protein
MQLKRQFEGTPASFILSFWNLSKGQFGETPLRFVSLKPSKRQFEGTPASFCPFAAF